MPYRLNKGIYAVRCRHPRCTFNTELEIEENIMGMTESDVEAEAMKVARGMASVKHDSLHGRHHALHNPEIRMASGSIRLTGAGPVRDADDWFVREFRKGDVIVKKGDAASWVCEVLRGVAYPAHNKQHRYAAGDCFGVAALLPNRSRMTDVVAGADGTKVGFYRLSELNKKDPHKASRLLNRVIADTLDVIEELDGRPKD